MAPLVTISDIDELSTRPGRRFIEVTQLVKDWNRDPSRRSLMVLEPPTSGSRAHRTAMAAITRCLCMRDRVALPTWVHDYGPLAEPVSLSGESLDGPMGAAALAAKYCILTLSWLPG